MNKLTIFTAVTILAGAATAAMTGCEAAKDAANAGAEQCGLTCPTNGIAQGNASISGVANIDGFFGAVVNYSTTAAAVVDGLTAPLADIKAQLGLEATATPAQVVAAIKANYGITGTFKVDYKPPKCQVSAQASLKATAKCDASVDPGSAKVECTGRCDADVKVTGGKAGCDVAADMHCTAPSANVACEGSCKGTCNLTAAATCTGTCNGTCNGTCDVKDAQGNCAGKCDGTCQGKCELAAGASCSGTCQGDCSVAAKGGSCEGSAKVECYAEPPSGSATVSCNAKCQGEVTPPSAKAECNASASANASFNADCTPPSIDIVMDAGASATINAAGYATFEENFKADMAAMVTALQRADLVLKAGVSIVASVPEVTASFNAAASGKLDLKTSQGLICAVAQLPAVAGVIQSSTTALTAQVQASAAFVAAFK